MKDCRPIDRLGYRYEAALALMATKDETLFRGSLTRLTDLGAVAAARLVRRPCERLIFGEFPPAYAAQAGTHLRGLTNCEEILDLLSDGQSNEVIAATLFISVRIVDHHVCAIPSNRRASTRERAAREAIKLGLTRSDRSLVAFSLDATDNE